MKSLLWLTLIIAGPALADMPNEQYDWSGGPGVPGPVYWFDDTFDYCRGIDWSDTPGFILLSPSDGSTGSDYVSSGSLVSSILEIPMGTDWEILWGDIWWESFEPPGTCVCFQLRVGFDWQQMLEWGDTVFVSGTPLDPLLPNDVFYIQYRVILLTRDPQVSPALDRAVIEGWYPGSVGSGTVPFTPDQYLTISPNPSYNGEMTLTTASGIHGHTEVRVYDPAGRLIEIPISGNLCGEAISATVSGLNSGIYLVVLETAAQRFSARVSVVPRP